MATKTVRLPVTVGVIDRANSITEDGKDGKGSNPLVFKNVAIKHIEAGQPVTLDEAEADALVERFGKYDESAAALRTKGISVASARR